MKIAVIGGRKFNNYRKMDEVIKTAPNQHGFHEKPSLIVSGGAKGADTLANKWAIANRVTFTMHPVLQEEIDEMGFSRAAKRRNLRVITGTDLVIAFPDKDSRGTWHAINLAKYSRIPVIVCLPDGRIEFYAKEG